MGGGFLEKKKESSSADVFTVISDDDEVISSDYSYKFTSGKSGIELSVCIYRHVHSNRLIIYGISHNYVYSTS